MALSCPPARSFRVLGPKTPNTSRARPADDSCGMEDVLSQLSLEYSYEDLLKATRGFDAAQCLGKGSFGGVYRGMHQDGTEIAVKVIEAPEAGGFEEEVLVLSKFRHPNLVILMGFARHETSRLLVYELLEGGDVFQRLHKSWNSTVPFSWRQRVSVALDAACGLSHLHHSKPKVFHRDIKCPNILLDRNGTGKMADFGLACLSHAKEHKVAQTAGTVGYACPLYVQRGVVTEGSEVYSFGIVLLEMMTSRAPAWTVPGADGKNQWMFLISHIGGNLDTVLGLVDVKAHFPLAVSTAVAKLALRCTHGEEERRPGFAQIVSELRALRDLEEESLPSAAVTADPGHHAASPRPAVDLQQIRVHAEKPQAPQQHVLQAYAPELLQVQAGQLQHQNQGKPPELQPQLQQPQVQELQQHPQLQQLQQQQLQQHQLQLQQQLQVQQLQPHQLQVQQPQPQVQQQGQYFQSHEWQQRAQQYWFHPEFPPREEQVHQQQGQRYTFFQPGSQLPQNYGVHLQPSPAVSVLPPRKVAGILWTLECVYAKCTDVNSLPREHKSLYHLQEPGETSVPTLRVGRLFQEPLFAALLPDEEVRKLVAREHFQIWAEEMPQKGSPGTSYLGLPCYFFLTNFSATGTCVSGNLVQGRGQQVPLHSGDVISLVAEAGAAGKGAEPFLEFCFDLTSSILGDADSPVRAAPSVSARTTCSSRPQEPERNAKEPLSPSAPVVARGGTSFCGPEVEPLFVLEVGGTGVRSGVPAELRKIVHGWTSGQPEAACPSLGLGRAWQPGFWEKLLTEGALASLEDRQLVIEVCTVGSGTSRASFTLRNLSATRRLEVGNLEAEGTQSLAQDEHCPLQHGDSIFVSSSKGSTLWLSFRDLLVGQVPSARGGVTSKPRSAQPSHGP